MNTVSRAILISVSIFISVCLLACTLVVTQTGVGKIRKSVLQSYTTLAGLDIITMDDVVDKEVTGEQLLSLINRFAGKYTMRVVNKEGTVGSCDISSFYDKYSDYYVDTDAVYLCTLDKSVSSIVAFTFAKNKCVYKPLNSVDFSVLFADKQMMTTRYKIYLENKKISEKTDAIGKARSEYFLNDGNASSDVLSKDELTDKINDLSIVGDTPFDVIQRGG